MSFVFESTARSRSSARVAGPSRRSVSERWGPIGTLAIWLGFRAKGPARGKAGPSDEQKAWAKAKTAMVAVGDGMLSRSRRDHQPLSMVVLDIQDLPQLARVFGTDIAGQFVSQALGQLNGIATSTGFAVRTGATVFTLLLPGFTHEQAVAAVHEALGSPCRIEYHAGGHDAVLTPEFVVKTVSRDTVTVGEIYQSLRRSMSQSLPGDQRRENPLLREREPYTLPTEPQSASGNGSPQAIGQAVFDAAAATVPMPLRLLEREREPYTLPMEPKAANQGSSPGRTRQAAYCPTAATIPMPMGPR
jgi:GGDEF domain-containing protein